MITLYWLYLPGFADIVICCIIDARHVNLNVNFRCVMKMDHHCPWINTCCGHFNHANFTYFLFFAPCGCIHALTILIPSIYKALHFVSILSNVCCISMHCRYEFYANTKHEENTPSYTMYSSYLSVMSNLSRLALCCCI